MVRIMRKSDPLRRTKHDVLDAGTGQNAISGETI